MMSAGTMVIPLDKLAGLMVEHWRLATLLGQREGGPAARHALRKMEDFFKGCELEARGFDGLAYDAGMSARVMDMVVDMRLGKGMAVVVETLAPLILHQGMVLRPAEVVVATRDGAAV